MSISVQSRNSSFFQIPYDINLVISRYRLVTEILSFLHGRKYYQEILDFKNNLKELYEKILDFIDEYDFSNSINSNKRDAFELLTILSLLLLR